MFLRTVCPSCREAYELTPQQRGHKVRCPECHVVFAPEVEEVAFGSRAGRWVLAVAVLGSGMAFLDGTVVNVAVPKIGEDLHASTSSLQWILNGYQLTLASLILLGGSLGDRNGRRRIFQIGTGVFTVASLLCAVAPTAEATFPAAFPTTFAVSANTPSPDFSAFSFLAISPYPTLNGRCSGRTPV